MPDRIPPWQSGARFVGVVLSRRDDSWRYALMVEGGGILDGGIADLSPEAPAEHAQARLEEIVTGLGRDFQGRDLIIEWSPSDTPGWWQGEVAEREAD